MSVSRLDRLRSMTREELSFRVAVTARTHAQRASWLARRPRWDRSSLASALTPDTLGGPIGDAIARRDWAGAHRHLFDRLRSRPTRFVLNPGSAAALRRAILNRRPDAAFDAAARAERVIAGDYDLLGYRGLRFDLAGEPGSIDWHLDPVHDATPPRAFWADVPYLDPKYGDHKIIWELNRHQHWLALSRARWLTGDDRYASVLRQQLADWLDANPPLTGVNWASMLELGFRSVSWLWTLHALLVHDDGFGEPWIVDLIVGLDRQLRHVEQNLSYYFSPNTHLTGEALALYVAGHALPELARSAQWVDVGRKVLLHEIGRQISRDGGHVERSTHYHRYTIDFYLLALLTAELADDEEATGAFREAVSRMARYLRGVARSDGRIVSIGDDDGGSLWPIAGRDPHDVRDTLAAAAIVLGEPGLAPWGVTEEALWLTWSAYGEAASGWSDAEPAPQAAAADAASPAGCRLQTTLFGDTGYLVARDDTGSELLFDVGSHGYLNAGHAHADALAVTLSVLGRALLVDPGTATYTMDPALRDRMRSSMSHNTLTLDGVSPSVPAGPFHWKRTADARLDGWRANAGFAWAEGAHDGYPGTRHRRTIVQAAHAGTLIVDQVIGGARHTAQLHWHFDPSWDVACETARRVRARHADGTIAWLVRDNGSLWLVNGDEDTGLGWYSPRYGVVLPTWAARVTKSGTAPLTMVTWVGSTAGAPSLERVQHEADPGGDAIGVRIVEDAAAWITLLRPGDSPVRPGRSIVAADYQTDARVLHYATRDGALRRLSVADATRVLCLREDLLSVAADDHVHDLTIAIEGGVLDLWASHPVPRVQLQGSALTTVAVARVNGRELPAGLPGRHASLEIAASAWPDPRTTDPPVADRTGPQQGPRPYLEMRTTVCAE
jgi:uncharacterized heparinase superfamily protein